MRRNRPLFKKSFLHEMCGQWAQVSHCSNQNLENLLCAEALLPLKGNIELSKMPPDDGNKGNGTDVLKN